MTYTNGFSINAAGNECFITLLQNKPSGKTKVTEEVETIVMTEQVARQLMIALSKVYQKVDQDRLARKTSDVTEGNSQLS